MNKRYKSAEVDTDAVRELSLYLENESPLYKQKQSILKNLGTKMARGEYKPELAVKLWMYWVEAGAKSYKKEFGDTFEKSVKQAVAEQLEKDYRSEITGGEHDYLLPKKYKKSASWLETAISELAEDQDLDVDDAKQDGSGNYGYGESVIFGNRDYTIFEDEDAAERAAIDMVKEQLEDEPELFTQSWLESFITMTDTDRRIISGEEADNYINDVSERELLDLVSDFKMFPGANELKDEYEELVDSDDDAGAEAKIEEIRETAYDEYYEYIYAELEDPVQYFVHDHGIYTIEELLEASFITIDHEEAAEDAVRTDGAAHFLSSYDGNVIELDSGAVAYRTN